MMTLADLRDLALRATLTFVYTVLAGLVTVELADLTLTLAGALALAGVAAALSVVKTAAAQMLAISTRYTWTDIVWRVVWTFVQSFTAALVVAGTDLASLATWQAAALAGIAAVISLTRSLLEQVLTGVLPIDSLWVEIERDIRPKDADPAA